MPLYFQSAQELSPSRSGALLLPITISECTVAIFAGFCVYVTNSYLELIWTGTGLMAIGHGLYITLSARSSINRIVAFEIISGAGIGCLFDTVQVALQAVVTQADTGTTVATFAFLRNLGMAMSIVIAGTVFQNGMEARQELLMRMGLDDVVRVRLSGTAAAANVNVTREIDDPVLKQAVKDTFADSLRGIWIMHTVVAVLCALAGLFVQRRPLNMIHRETRTGVPARRCRTPAMEVTDRELKDISNAVRQMETTTAYLPMARLEVAGTAEADGFVDLDLSDAGANKQRRGESETVALLKSDAGGRGMS